MKPEDQRIAIAEACGWRKIHQIRNYPPSWGPGSCRLTRPANRFTRGGPDVESITHDPEVYRKGWSDEVTYVDFKGVPDYPSDLNAMHEAEKVLTDEEENLVPDFVRELSAILRNEDGDSDDYVTWFHDEAYVVIHATAAQRAEAFLRTLGLWEGTDSQK